MMRGSPVIVVIRPKVPVAKLLFGRPQLKVLNRLNTSSRNSIVRVAAKDTRRDSARSTLWNPGPLMLLRALVPNFPAAGCAKAAGFRKLFRVFAPYTSSDTWSTRWLAIPLNALSRPLRIVIHGPERALRIPETRQFEAISRM